MSETNQVREHVNRCVELYGCPIDIDFKEPVERETYEQLRADLLLLVGICMALIAKSENFA